MKNWHINQDRPTEVVDAEGVTVAMCCQTSSSLADDQSEANARLISAAPELLEAICKFIACEKAMDGQDDVMGMLLYAEFAEMAREALAKATSQ